MTINQATKDFIILHSNEDVRKVALMYKPESGVDLPFALDQIAGRQTARTKLPTWYDTPDVIFPPHISMEQCSSEQTAKYKVSAMKSALRNVIPDDKEAENCHFIDFTGGFGVDFSYMAACFSSSTYIERQAHLCEIARHNLPLLGLKGAEVLCADSEEAMMRLSETSQESASFLLDMPQGKPRTAFLDPARRDQHGQRTYAIADCTPDVCKHLPALLASTHLLMLKLSPMLDWHSTVRELNEASASNDAVREVHIVSTGNECKELLIILSEKYRSPLTLHCVNDGETFVIETDSDTKNGISIKTEDADSGKGDSGVEADSGNKTNQSPSLGGLGETSILLVPNASIMKAGCFSEVESHFGVRQISQNSHLFLSDEAKENFPGRTFSILRTTTMNKKELRKALEGIDRANIATRNFPISPEILRKKLKLKDGGEFYIFATTTADNEHRLFICHKA